MKIGDKVRVIRSHVPSCVPNGSVCCVVGVDTYSIEASCSGSSNPYLGWTFMKYDVELIEAHKPDTYTRILEAMLTGEQVATAQRIAEAI